MAVDGASADLEAITAVVGLFYGPELDVCSSWPAVPRPPSREGSTREARRTTGSGTAGAGAKSRPPLRT
jgi:hypothetical protein